ncbi:hypothetical protein NUW54_g1296 [Trametes sanguinea]|uniref:Uncharacterized protein n=1 Tax=Trametes sanguinea TaxID=158606 RepID=A0ACC1QAI3_9APHY|nr:hypothetical protein NUW54_g1296 [Trametes sanguinea]
MIPPHDLTQMLANLAHMQIALSQAAQLAPEGPDSLPAVPLGSRISTGGRPAVSIQPEDLAALSQGRTTRGQIAHLYDCHPRTIRRRLLAFGLSVPGLPVFQEEYHADGSTTLRHTPGGPSDLSQISDEDLDQLILSAHEQFPSFGRRMIDGYLLTLGERVPRQRVEESYARVVGPSPATFGPRRIERRSYTVPGPNSLWHHDGQHGLIRWKIVIHAFIDGFSRFVLGIRAHNNNRAQTVLELFEDIACVHGYPSRVRGDHGTENLLVAARMEEVWGAERGSYIWGRSVHNIRIERLWVEVTSGFGSKWKVLFQELEAMHGLNIDNDAHIWLLQHLFLDAINHDAEVWTAVWNEHAISRRGEPHLSPSQMYVHGLAEHGQRGVLPASLDLQAQNPPGARSNTSAVEDMYEGYGIDWEELQHTRIRAHHAENNHDHDRNLQNPFLSDRPDRLSHIEVQDARCPFTLEQVAILDAELSQFPCSHPTTIQACKELWTVALQLASAM